MPYISSAFMMSIFSYFINILLTKELPDSLRNSFILFSGLILSYNFIESNHINSSLRILQITLLGL